MHVGKFDVKKAKEDANFMKNRCERCEGKGIEPNTTPGMAVQCKECGGTGEKRAMEEIILPIELIDFNLVKKQETQKKVEKVIEKKVDNKPVKPAENKIDNKSVDKPTENKIENKPVEA